MVKHIYSKGTEHHEIEHYDIIILGGGPAGMTAALYAGRYNLKVAVIAKSIGGTANLAGEVENWPGFFGPGMELMKSFREQAEKFGARFLEAEVTDVFRDENGYVLEIGEKEIHGKALIIALGTKHRTLDIPKEKEFIGKGVSYCTTCDGMFFKNKTVIVVGGSDSAAKAALYMSEIAKKVYISYRGEELRCEPISLKKIKENKNIEIIYNSIPTTILGEKKVTGIELDVKGKKQTIALDGIFVEIGSLPATEIIQDLKLAIDEKEYIITDKSTKTNQKGCFAAGDSTNGALKQMITAAGEGAVAAKSAYDYLRFEYK